MQSAVGAQERLLRNVLLQVGVAHHARDQALWRAAGICVRAAQKRAGRLRARARRAAGRCRALQGGEDWGALMWIVPHPEMRPGHFLRWLRRLPHPDARMHGAAQVRPARRVGNAREPQPSAVPCALRQRSARWFCKSNSTSGTPSADRPPGPRPSLRFSKCQRWQSQCSTPAAGGAKSAMRSRCMPDTAHRPSRCAGVSVPAPCATHKASTTAPAAASASKAAPAAAQPSGHAQGGGGCRDAKRISPCWRAYLASRDTPARSSHALEDQGAVFVPPKPKLFFIATSILRRARRWRSSRDRTRGLAPTD